MCHAKTMSKGLNQVAEIHRDQHGQCKTLTIPATTCLKECWAEYSGIPTSGSRETNSIDADHRPGSYRFYRTTTATGEQRERERRENKRKARRGEKREREEWSIILGSLVHVFAAHRRGEATEKEKKRWNHLFGRNPGHHLHWNHRRCI